ncbi:hypothetical protein [Kytococcus sedentarius]|uniref:hypothetical protein n=1 Tax=Kytococcus sedentarius TaxID=1276 RepID=UPI0035BC5E79
MNEGRTLKHSMRGRRFVVTADQQSSRHRADAVPGMLGVLSDLPGAPTADGGLAFDRAAGDEIQGLVTSGAAVVEVVQALLRTGGWRIGIGLGPVEEPLAPSVREARGPAFIAARRAVERSHRCPQPVAVDANAGVDTAVDAPGSSALRGAETALWLWAAVLARRTDEGWEVAELMEQASTQKDVAATLGVSASAVSQRLRTAGWVESQRGAELVATLLEAAADDCATLGGAAPAGGATDDQETA